jgi:hypothetical protein
MGSRRLAIAPDADVKLLPSYQMPTAFGAGTASTFVILCCWNI